MSKTNDEILENVRNEVNFHDFLQHIRKNVDITHELEKVNHINCDGFGNLKALEHPLTHK